MSNEKLKPSAPPPYGTLINEEQEPPPSTSEVVGDTTDQGETGDGSPSSSSDRCPAVDSRYIRSIEGILRLITIVSF